MIKSEGKKKVSETENEVVRVRTKKEESPKTSTPSPEATFNTPETS